MRIILVSAIAAALGAAPAQAQYTERWSDTLVLPDPAPPGGGQGQPAPALPMEPAADLRQTPPGPPGPGGDGMATPAIDREVLNNLINITGKVVGAGQFCAIDVRPLNLAFDALMARVGVAPGGDAPSLAAFQEARADAHEQLSAKGTLEPANCPPQISGPITQAIRDLLNSVNSFLGTLPQPDTAPVTLAFEGSVSNDTVGMSSTATLSLTRQGDRLTGHLRTQPPLYASGPLSGSVMGDQCTLSGRMQEGYDLSVTGRCDAGRFEGRYTVTVDGQTQRGGFQMQRRPTH